MIYVAKPIPTQAIKLDIAITYEKWGGTQKASVGDWLLCKNGETYTCEGKVFDTTYVPLEGRDGWYYKYVAIEAEVASSDGKVKTLEGYSDYKAGDYLVTNPGGDQYVIEAAKFTVLYDPEV
jgi:hypothetical protein